MSRFGGLGVSRPVSDAGPASVVAGQRLAVGGRVVSPHPFRDCSRPVLPHRRGVRATVQNAELLEVLGARPGAVASTRPWLAGHGRQSAARGDRPW
jgi:hypothetical protein